MEEIMERLKRLEFHQKLLLGMIDHTGRAFDMLVIKKNLSETEVDEFLRLCEELNKEMEKQKAEKFVFYAPLFREFTARLNPKLEAKETILACIRQNIYAELMHKLLQNTT